MRIVIAKSAVFDLEKIDEFYTEQDVPLVGKRLIGDIIQAIESLKEHTLKGIMVPEFENATIRELIKPPFRIVYQTTNHQINIIRIWRSERMLKLD